MKMPNQKQKYTKRNVVLSIVALIIILGGYTAYAAVYSQWPFTDNKSTSDTQNTDTNSKDSTSSPSDSDESSPTNKAPKQNNVPSDDKVSKDTLTGVINYKDVSDGTLSIRTTIDQKVSSGTCKLTLTNQNSGATVTKSTNIIANPSSSTCNGFDMPTSQLNSGTWNITIQLTSGDKSGTIEGTVKI